MILSHELPIGKGLLRKNLMRKYMPFSGLMIITPLGAILLSSIASSHSNDDTRAASRQCISASKGFHA